MEETFKLFPKTFDDDQIRIEFDSFEERHAFDDVLTVLEYRIQENGKEREKKITDFKFKTTLQMEVVQEKKDEIRKILGLQTFDISSKENTIVIPLPRHKK